MDHKTADTKIKRKIHHRKKNPISNITKKEVYNFQSNQEQHQEEKHKRNSKQSQNQQA